MARQAAMNWDAVAFIRILLWLLLSSFVANERASQPASARLSLLYFSQAKKIWCETNFSNSAIPWSNGNLCVMSGCVCVCALKCDASEIELCGKFVIYSRIHYLQSQNSNTNCVCRFMRCGTYCRTPRKIFQFLQTRHTHTHTQFSCGKQHYVKLNSKLVYSLPLSHTHTLIHTRIHSNAQQPIASASPCRLHKNFGRWL